MSLKKILFNYERQKSFEMIESTWASVNLNSH